MVYGNDPLETDEIWPRTEGGPTEPYNQRRVPRSVNRRKGARMPTVWEVLESHDIPRLAREIDARSLEKPFKNPRNKDKGFGGFPKFRLF